MIGKYPKSIPSKAYCDKLPRYVEELLGQYNYAPAKCPLRATVDIYEQNESWLKDFISSSPSGNYYGTDLDNKLSSVFDILVEAQVIIDDVIILETHVRKHINQKLPSGKDWGAKVFLEKWNGFHQGF